MGRSFAGAGCCDPFLLIQDGGGESVWAVVTLLIFEMETTNIFKLGCFWYIWQQMSSNIWRRLTAKVMLFYAKNEMTVAKLITMVLYVCQS